MTEENKNEIKKLEKKHKDEMDKMRAEMAKMKLANEEGLRKFQSEIGDSVKCLVANFGDWQGLTLFESYK